MQVQILLFHICQLFRSIKNKNENRIYLPTVGLWFFRQVHYVGWGWKHLHKSGIANKSNLKPWATISQGHYVYILNLFASVSCNECFHPFVKFRYFFLATGSANRRLLWNFRCIITAEWQKKPSINTITIPYLNIILPPWVWAVILFKFTLIGFFHLPQEVSNAM